MSELARAAAVVAAAVSAGPGATPEQITNLAGPLATWIGGPRFTVTVDSLTWKQNQPAAPPRRTIRTQGGAVQLHDDEQVDLTVHAHDWKQFDTTTGNLTATPADTSIITTVINGATVTCVAGVLGSTTVDISDGVAHFTEAFDVIPGDAVAIVIEEGTPYKQPAPPAP